MDLKDKTGEKISDALYPIAVSETGNLEDYWNIFSEINNTPKVSLKIEPVDSGLVIGEDGIASGKVRISNTSGQVVFFIRARMLEESDTLRTTYSDNYISLLPGEAKVVNIEIESRNRARFPQRIHFEVSGISCLTQSLEMKVGEKQK